jgi:hypothetical protein
MIEIILDYERKSVDMTASGSSEGSGGGEVGTSGGHRLLRRIAIFAGALLIETIPVWRRGYGVGGNVIVRCREGHLFTTIWIPGASLKSLRFGPRRFQRCPVGHHWSLVTLVRESDLSARARRSARSHKDIRIP